MTEREADDHDEGRAAVAGQQTATEPPGDQAVRMTAFVHGQVQGVGFRWWTRARALELGLAGSATNLPDGRVQVVAEGPRSACTALRALLAGPAAPGSVSLVVEQFAGIRGEHGFVER